MTKPKATFAGLALVAALCSGFTLGLTAPAWAGFDEGEAAYQRGDYATALREFRPLANQGNASAQVGLGSLYRTGHGVPQDYAEAMKWFRKAAVQGDSDAYLNLGYMYRKGRGVPQDYAEAAKWYRKAANQGTSRAQLRLGVMYLRGNGVPEDYVQAHMWASLSAAQGQTSGASLRDGLAKMMTPAQISEAEKLAREWKAKK